MKPNNRNRIGRPPKRPEFSGETPAKPSFEMRVPRHGGGLLRVGNPGNAGGGRHPDAQRQQARDLVDLAMEEIRARLVSKKYPMSMDELVRAVAALGRIGLPSQFEVSGPGGAGIPLDQARKDLIALLQKRMGDLPRTGAAN